MTVTDNLNMTLWSRNSQNDKDVSGNISVFKGRMSFNVWRKGSKRPVVNVQLSTEALRCFSKLAGKIVGQGPKGKVKLTIQEWDKEERKFKDKGFFVVGVNDKLVPYFGVSTPEGQHAFPIYLKRPNVLSDENISQSEGAILTLETVCEDIRDRALLLESLSNEKRDFNSTNNNSKSSYNNNSSKSVDLDDGLPDF